MRIHDGMHKYRVSEAVLTWQGSCHKKAPFHNTRDPTLALHPICTLGLPVPHESTLWKRPTIFQKSAKVTQRRPTLQSNNEDTAAWAPSQCRIPLQCRRLVYPARRLVYPARWLVYPALICIGSLDRIPIVHLTTNSTYHTYRLSLDPVPILSSVWTGSLPKGSGSLHKGSLDTQWVCSCLIYVQVMHKRCILTYMDAYILTWGCTRGGGGGYTMNKHVIRLGINMYCTVGLRSVFIVKRWTIRTLDINT